MAVLVSASTYGQGTIFFNNRVTGLIDAPVSRCDGTGAGAGVTAQLFLVLGAGASTTYTPLEPATTFRTVRPEVEYYVVQPIRDVVVPGFGYREQVTVVLRAWEGANYETAQVRGQSPSVTVTLGPPVPSPLPILEGALIGLQGFSLCIPEPSAMALGLLGAALLYRRRT
jgi:hypothetical protein